MPVTLAGVNSLPRMAFPSACRTGLGPGDCPRSIARLLQSGPGKFSSVYRGDLSESRKVSTAPGNPGRSPAHWPEGTQQSHCDRSRHDLQSRPGASKTIKVEALSLSLYPHTAGPYTLDRPDEESAKLGRRVYLLWKRHQKSPLRNSPIRLSQAAVYLETGQERAAIQKMFSADELRELQEISP